MTIARFYGMTVELLGEVIFVGSSIKICLWCNFKVVGYLPNCPLAIEAMAAAASIGAIWSSTSPDFGVSGVLDRFQQIRPKVIFSVESVSYNMKTHDHLSKLRQVVDGLYESLEQVCQIQNK